MSCPLPLRNYPSVLLAHGGGGRLSQQLVEEVFARSFQNPLLLTGHDSAQFTLPPGRVAMTTDCYVVQPLFFPGGDIGSLAVHGTVNDLAMSGAHGLYLSCGFILEEGLPMETLWRVAQSMAAAARRCGVQIVTGDTKVVGRGKGDGIFINTSGVGVMQHDLQIGPAEPQPGDVILCSGDLGRHGMAIMAAREGLEFESAITSDSAPVHEPILKMIQEGVRVRCLRDLTRGGLAAALNEIAQAAQVKIAIDERQISVRDDVHAACEILGLDALQVANEGRFIAFIPEEDEERALNVLHGADVSVGAV